VQRVNGHNPEEVYDALAAARANVDQPSLIACRTRIGYGSPNRENTAKAHGEPLGEAEVTLLKQRLGWPVDEAFYIPDTARELLELRAAQGAARHTAWRETFAQYEREYPDLAAELTAEMNRQLHEGWDAQLPTYKAGESISTRAASGAVLNALAPSLPALIGGSADLTPSNNTQPKGEAGRAISHGDFHGYYIHFGVREHGMGAILNGLALHGGLRPYGGTFLIFSDYMRPPIRMAALMGAPVVFVFTHDSVGLGEDGPTHQPVEHLTGLRAIPNLVVIRPADANETVEAWRIALQNNAGPTALVLTRQSVPVIDRSGYAAADNVRRGAYVLADADPLDAIVIATGSEVHLALVARETLAREGINVRVVSMPSHELFEQQDAAYRESVLPRTTRLASRWRPAPHSAGGLTPVSMAQQSSASIGSAHLRPGRMCSGMWGHAGCGCGGSGGYWGDPEVRVQ
jgi:transketolase